MANKSDKRIAAENASTLAMLKYGFLATHLLQLLCFLLFSSQRTRSHILLYILTSVPSLALYAQLVSMGSPRAKSAGDDLGQAGLTQYMLDVVFVTWAAQTGALITSKAWWLYALIPGFAAYKIAKIAAPFLFKAKDQAAVNLKAAQSQAQAQAKSTEGMSKRQQKMNARYEKGDKRYQRMEVSK